MKYDKHTELIKMQTICNDLSGQLFKEPNLLILKYLIMHDRHQYKIDAHLVLFQYLYLIKA